MRSTFVAFAVAAAFGAGYFVGESGSFSVGAALAGGAALLTLFMAWAMNAPQPPKTVSLRPASAAGSTARATAGGRTRASSTATSATSAARRVLRPGELARLREQERILSQLPEVAVRLAGAGEKQVALIKVLRNYLDIGMKEAKSFAEEAKKGQQPLVIASIAVEHAKQFARDIEAAGGTVQFEEPVIR